MKRLNSGNPPGLITNFAPFGTDVFEMRKSVADPPLARDAEILYM